MGQAARLPSRTLSESSKLEILRQLSLQFEAGIPIHRCLEFLASSRQDEEREAVVAIHKDLVHGSKLSEALARSGGYSRVVVAMTRTGEESGRLHRTLALCVSWGDRDQQLKKRLRGVLTYPAIVAFAALGMAFILLKLLVPPFAEVLRDLDAPLPVFSQVVFALASWAESPFVWLATLLVAGQGVFWLVRSWEREDFRRKLSDLFVHVPVVGNLIKLSVQVRLFLAVHALLAAGIDLVSALKHGLMAANHPSYDVWGSQAMTRILDGEQLSQTMIDSDLFSKIASALVRVGEHTGKLELAFSKSVELLQQDMEHQIDVFATLIEPLLLLFAGGLVGAVLAATFLPMYHSIGQI